MVAIVSSLGTVQALVSRWLHDKYTVRKDAAVWKVDTARRCESPVYLELTGLPSAVLADGSKPLLADVWVRCRRCGWCRRQRAREWAERVAWEMTRAPRSWLVTLTLRPEEQYRAAASYHARGRRPATAAQEFSDRCVEIGREITRWLKRVRKESGARLRYVLVAEPHKSGDPHFHAIVHEIEGSVKWRTLTSQWKLGHSQAKLCDKSVRTARYLTKYLSKSMLARVRASVRYGQVRSWIIAGDELPDEGLPVPPGTPGRIGGLVPAWLSGWSPPRSTPSRVPSFPLGSPLEKVRVPEEGQLGVT